jgi:uncharacterized protein YifN (PemK superfamily)
VIILPNRITIYDEATNQYIRLDANNADYLNNRNAKNFDEARADIVRESIHSGLTTMIIPFSSTTNKDLTKSENRASIGSNLYSTSTPNSFQVANMVAYINGYKLNINDGTGNKAFEITLPSPPLDGANVDCLVFIEAYFPSNDTTGNMSYKIRSIQGIDYNISRRN